MTSKTPFISTVRILRSSAEKRASLRKMLSDGDFKVPSLEELGWMMDEVGLGWALVSLMRTDRAEFIVLMSSGAGYLGN